MKIIDRIKKRIKMTHNNFVNDSKFSITFAVVRLIDDLSWRIGWKKIAEKFHKKKDILINEYLCNSFDSIIEEYKEKNDEWIVKNSAPIWVCWWDGEDAAPSLVKQCINSIRKNSGTHSVVFVDKNNYTDYIEIPGYMMEKIKSKKMSLAALSDYIRASLIYKYGGLWLDSTIYCSETVNSDWFSMPIFTCRRQEVDCRYISKMRWTTFCIGGFQGNVFFGFFKKAFEEYWSKHDTIIDYLLVDYVINIAYENIPAVKEMFLKIPYNNIHIDDLQAAMNEALPGASFDNIIKEDTVLYKLSWRETYFEKTADGQESVYGYFLNMKIDEK